MERSPRTGAANSLGGLVPRNRVRVSLHSSNCTEGVGWQGWASIGHTGRNSPDWASRNGAGAQCRAVTILSQAPRAHLSWPVTRSTSVRSSTPLTRPTCRVGAQGRLWRTKEGEGGLTMTAPGCADAGA